MDLLSSTSSTMASLSRSVVRSALQSTRVATRCVPSGSRAPIGIAHRHELRAFGSATASRHAEARPGPPLSQTNRTAFGSVGQTC